MTGPFEQTEEVRAALDAGAPVVALESTIITHGMPWPRNFETARQVEDEIRAHGGTPATMAVIKGVLHIGLTEGQMTDLAKARDVAKLSRADLPVAMATRTTGATTVAATMIAARLAGIEVFATGGIGGVHRGAERSFDVSADLRELSETPVTVVAAGAKAILDLPKTWEMLETLGVPVIAVGQDVLPAFWSRGSEHPAPLRLDRPADIAAAHVMRGAMGLPGGQLVANPIPEADEIPAETLAPIIEQALSEAIRDGVSAKAVTPYLLSRIFELTEGRSLEANIALVLNNARLAAGIAREIGILRKEIAGATDAPL
ncbi:pseudouridine-5'-phosphate glycosidase [Palleronia marisminoris]|uniref:Pseudouridine-5'-phosphate glycosidase n=1 Tax=Palleronia marisminoris TaxID=315423 RepID=A0A1Y5TBL2_9RHOB|nr:pseudouridine-5'-phosphate glycosidase [Palleronia marisminoris]SFH34498.1 pseudouridine-5'-phosphate glycosidase [Palleronia marisminoris]SLN59938.1 Pseudouridine-5'-phosphate glycosidase [Palleronia marisminoris]